MNYNNNNNDNFCRWPISTESDQLQNDDQLNQPKLYPNWQREKYAQFQNAESDNCSPYGNKPTTMEDLTPTFIQKKLQLTETNISHETLTDQTPLNEKKPFASQPEPSGSNTSPPRRGFHKTSKAVLMEDIVPSRRTRVKSVELKQNIKPADEGIQKWQRYAKEQLVSSESPNTDTKSESPKISDQHHDTHSDTSDSTNIDQGPLHEGNSPVSNEEPDIALVRWNQYVQENSKRYQTQLSPKKKEAPEDTSFVSGLAESRWAPKVRANNRTFSGNIVPSKSASSYTSKSASSCTRSDQQTDSLSHTSDQSTHDEPVSSWSLFRDTASKDEDNKTESNPSKEDQPKETTLNTNSPDDPESEWSKLSKKLGGTSRSRHAPPGYAEITEDHKSGSDQLKETTALNNNISNSSEDPESEWSKLSKKLGGTSKSRHAPPGYADESDNWRKKAQALMTNHVNINNERPRRDNNEKPRRQNNGTASSRWQQIAAQNDNAPEGYLHPDDRNKFGRRLLFNPFMEPSEMESKVKSGILYQGILRVSKNRQDAYVTSDDLDHDIYVGGMVDRNRALTGDLVAVEMLDVDQVWELKKERDMKRQEDRKRTSEEKSSGEPAHPEEAKDDELGTTEMADDEEEEHKPKHCGRVVGILMRPENTTYAGTISIERVPNNKPKEENKGGWGGHNQEKPKELRLAWFKPSDKKIPFIALRNQDIPRDLLDNEEHYKSHLFTAKIIRWQITDLNPTGRIVNELGPIGDLLAEKVAILADNSIVSNDFSPLALKCLPETPWSIPETEYNKRRDLRSARVFSIDPATAKDLDDALHIKELENGYYEVGVHIADVSYFLKRNTVLDTEARERGTSTYLVDSVIPMLPPLLCEELCSLNPGVERLAFSVIWKMDRTGKAVDTWFGRTIIKSCAKLAYEDAQNVIEGTPGRTDLQVYNDEDIFYIYSDIRRLYKLSREMRKRRYDNGCLSMNSVKLNFDLDESGYPITVSMFEAKEANQLIEEFMLFANITVAQKICDVFSDVSLLRRHQAPIEKRLDEFIKITDVLGLNFNGNSAGELQESFNRLKNKNVKDIMLVLAIRCMQKAKYFCSGSLDISKFKHYALSESIYTHFTSPIRRYADVVVHRLLEAALAYEQDPSKTAAAPYTKKVVQKIAFDCNVKKDGAKNAQDENRLLYLGKYLARKEEIEGPVYTKATVLVVGKQAFDIIVPEYGLEKRAHLDILPVESFNFDKNTMALDIFWKRGVPVTMHNEEKIYAQQREIPDNFSEEDEGNEVEDSLAALSLQEPKEYNYMANEDDLIPPVLLDETTCKQTIKMFSVIDVRIQVNMERSPPFINVYPVNPFSGEQQ